jgi:hypothetical protein
MRYSQLAVLLFRASGIMTLLYAVPMLLWVALTTATGATGGTGGTAAGGGSINLRSVMYTWGLYAAIGILALLLARPLGHVAAAGLEESPFPPPVA